MVRNIEVLYLTARQVVKYDVEVFEERIWILDLNGVEEDIPRQDLYLGIIHSKVLIVDPSPDLHLKFLRYLVKTIEEYI